MHFTGCFFLLKGNKQWEPVTSKTDVLVEAFILLRIENQAHKIVDTRACSCKKDKILDVPGEIDRGYVPSKG